jgi:hypothetical protein
LDITGRQVGSLQQIFGDVVTQLERITTQFPARFEEFFQKLKSLLHPHS